MRLWGPLPGRIIATLQDFMPAELDLIDAEMGQPTTADIPQANYHEELGPVVTDLPAIRIESRAMRPILVRPEGYGRSLDAWFIFGVYVDVAVQTADDDPVTLQRRVLTYLTAMFRILCVAHEGLDTIADPTRFVQTVEPEGDVDARPVVSDGRIVRGGILPIRVHCSELR